MNRTTWLLLPAAALLLQLAVLSGMILRWERVVDHGTAIRIPFRVLDRRDLFMHGRCLELSAGLECTDADLGKPIPEWDYAWWFRNVKPRTLWVELAPVPAVPGGASASHRAVKVAPKPRDGGLWARISGSSLLYADGAGGRKTIRGLRVSFPRRLFLDERLAGAAERLFFEHLDRNRRARDEGHPPSPPSAPPVAVYRAWHGNVILSDLELDGTSLLSLARPSSSP